MYFCNIAMSWIKYRSFDENSTWHNNILKGGTIISIQNKIWMALLLYLIYLGCMAFIIIVVMVKLL